MRWFIATTATVLIGTVLTLGCKQAVEGVIRHNPTFTALEATLVRGELQKALLTAADLPGSGWEEADPAEDDGKIGFCEGKPSSTVDTVATAFQRSESAFDIEFVDHMVFLYSTTGKAKEAMGYLSQQAQTCLTVDDDPSMVYQLAALAFPQLGDETVAVQLTLEVTQSDHSEPVSINLVYLRRDRLVTLLVHDQIGGQVDTGETEQMARYILEHLDAIA